MSLTSTSNPGNSRINELGALRGELPGNPFLARNAAGQQLYGVDANGDGLPDRGLQDINNDGLMDYIVSGTTPNGILLNEDVRARTLRPINKTHTISDGHTSDADNKSGSTDHNSRLLFQADFNVPFLEGWEGMAAYAHSEQRFRMMSNQNYDIEAMIQGVNCDVINDRDACYNPFFVTDQADNNSVHVMNAIAGRSREMEETWLDTIDLVFNGEIGLGGFELPGGRVLTVRCQEPGLGRPPGHPPGEDVVLVDREVVEAAETRLRYAARLAHIRYGSTCWAVNGDGGSSTWAPSPQPTRRAR